MKQIITLFILLVILVSGYLFIRGYKAEVEFEPPAVFLVDQWNEDAVDQLKLTFDDGTEFVFEKEDNKWQINNNIADQDRMTQLFDALSDAEITSLVSTNSLNHERFDVDSSGVLLSLSFSSEVFQELVIGKSAGGENVYVRLPESDEVYVLSGLPRYILSSDQDIWRDRSIVRVETDMIRGLAYSPSFGGWSLANSENGWQLQQGNLALQPADEQKSLARVARVVNLLASRFDREEDEIITPLSSFTIEEGTVDSLSKSYTYNIFTSSVPEVLMISGEDGVDYFVRKDSFEQIFVPYLEMLEELAPAVEEISE